MKWFYPEYENLYLEKMRYLFSDEDIPFHEAIEGLFLFRNLLYVKEPSIAKDYMLHHLNNGFPLWLRAALVYRGFDASIGYSKEVYNGHDFSIKINPFGAQRIFDTDSKLYLAEFSSKKEKVYFNILNINYYLPNGLDKAHPDLGFIHNDNIVRLNPATPEEVKLFDTKHIGDFTQTDLFHRVRRGFQYHKKPEVKATTVHENRFYSFCKNIAGEAQIGWQGGSTSSRI
jgi:hypothetical protein